MVYLSYDHCFDHCTPKIKTTHAQYQNESYQIEPHYILYRDELTNRNINFALPHNNNFNIFLFLFLPCPQRYFDLAI